MTRRPTIFICTTVKNSSRVPIEDRMLILDQPTAALDVQAETAFLKMMGFAAHDQATILKW